MRTFFSALCFLLLLGSFRSGASAQRRPPDEGDLVLTPSPEDDPIGVESGSTLDRVVIPNRNKNDSANGSTTPRPVPITRGEVLSAIPGIRETSHGASVVLHDGLADVQLEMRFANTSRLAGDLEYRVPVARGAGIVGFEIMRSSETVSPAPHIDAQLVRDARGSAILLRAGPVPPRGELTLRLAYASTAPLRGGVARFRLLPRGMDPRAAQASVSVTADDLSSLLVNGSDARTGATRTDAWQPVDMSGIAAARSAPIATLWRGRCTDRTSCVRVRVAAGSRTATPVDMVLLVDASPSMEGPARGRVLPAVAALLSQLPSGSMVRALAFAARAEPVVAPPTPPEGVALATIQEATTRDLGSATRFEAAWAVARGWIEDGSRRARSRILLIVGDGALTQSTEASDALAEAVRSGAQISVVNLADRKTADVLSRAARQSGGVVVAPGEEADAALRGAPDDRLAERVSLLLAPTLIRNVTIKVGARQHRLGALRAGEELTWEGVEEGARVALSSTSLRARQKPMSPEIASGLSARLRPAEETSSAETSPARRGIPAETVLEMLRTRVVPVARHCFRRDRAGRADYSVRAEFLVRLADQEVVSSDVSGTLEPELRRCLVTAVDTLDVPRFDGTIVVRYPVYTQREPPPPVLSLEPEIAAEVDRVIGSER